MNRLIVLLSFLLTFTTGCILDDWLGHDQPEPVPLFEIRGIVNIPDTGLSKNSSGKLAYKAMSGARAYLLQGDMTFRDMLDFKNRHLSSATTNDLGLFKFSGLAKGEKYHLIVDIDGDGLADAVQYNLEAQTDGTMTLSFFIRQKNSSDKWLFSVTTDKASYSHGEIIQIQVEGYSSEPVDLQVQIWNEKASGNYVWTSDEVTVNGNIDTSFEKEVPVAWTSGSGADYRIYIAIGGNLLDSTSIGITGNSGGDTTGPSPVTSLEITSSDVSFDSVRLAWSRPADDSTVAENLEYSVYQSSAANIDTVENILKNGTVLMSWKKDTLEYLVSGLSEKTDYWFNVLVNDENGNKTAYLIKKVTTPPYNLPPVIADIPDQEVPMDGNTGAMALDIEDDHTAASALVLSATSSNTALIPDANIVFGGAAPNFHVTVTPVAGKVGVSVITLRATDESGEFQTETFAVNVQADPPDSSDWVWQNQVRKTKMISAGGISAPAGSDGNWTLEIVFSDAVNPIPQTADVIYTSSTAWANGQAIAEGDEIDFTGLSGAQTGDKKIFYRWKETGGSTSSWSQDGTVPVKPDAAKLGYSLMHKATRISAGAVSDTRPASALSCFEAVDALGTGLVARGTLTGFDLSVYSGFLSPGQNIAPGKFLLYTLTDPDGNVSDYTLDGTVPENPDVSATGFTNHGGKIVVGGSALTSQATDTIIDLFTDNDGTRDAVETTFVKSTDASDHSGTDAVFSLDFDQSGNSSPWNATINSVSAGKYLAYQIRDTNGNSSDMVFDGQIAVAPTAVQCDSVAVRWNGSSYKLTNVSGGPAAFGAGNRLQIWVETSPGASVYEQVPNGTLAHNDADGSESSGNLDAYMTAAKAGCHFAYTLINPAGNHSTILKDRGAIVTLLSARIANGNGNSKIETGPEDLVLTFTPGHIVTVSVNTGLAFNDITSPLNLLPDQTAWDSGNSIVLDPVSTGGVSSGGTPNVYTVDDVTDSWISTSASGTANMPAINLGKSTSSSLTLQTGGHHLVPAAEPIPVDTAGY